MFIMIATDRAPSGGAVRSANISVVPFREYGHVAFMVHGVIGVSRVLGSVPINIRFFPHVRCYHQLQHLPPLFQPSSAAFRDPAMQPRPPCRIVPTETEKKVNCQIFLSTVCCECRPLTR